VANSPLYAFISGARAMLAAQLVVCVGAVALAGWTLGVTNQLIRERDRLQERVIQLEETIAGRGDIPPAPTAVVEPVISPSAEAYPGSFCNAVSPAAPVGAVAEIAPAPTRVATQQTAPPQRDLGRIVTNLFGPTPPLRTVVLHVRAQADLQQASRIARALQDAGELRVLIDVMPAGDPRQSGYAYFDGRQSRPAADVVARFHEAARAMQIAQWSAQLRGTALPAQGEYGADRLDIVLPPLPAPPAPVEPPPSDEALRSRTPG
jgi:hypothetical protein